MKKLFALSLLFAFLFACEESGLETSPDVGIEVEAGKSTVPTSCPPMSGSTSWSKTGTYNCHQYVKGALVSEEVNLYDGKPDAVDFSNDHTNASIQSDNNFIRVCNSWDAEATAVLPASKDHSSLILGNGSHAYSTPGGSDIWTSGSALNYSTACDYEYFSSVEDVYISGPVVSGNNYTFTLENVGSHSYILTDANRWSYYASAFNVITKTNTTLTLSPKSGWGGTHSISAKLNTSGTDNPTGNCATGVNGYQTASTYTPIKYSSLTIQSSCDGKLDGNTLYTWNSVSKYVMHNVVMDESGWSWTKTSGSCSWSTSGSGKYMDFSISNGSVTFQATKSGCPTKTVTFTSY